MRIITLFLAGLLALAALSVPAMAHLPALVPPTVSSSSIVETGGRCGPHSHYLKGHHNRHGHWISGHCVHSHRR